MKATTQTTSFASPLYTVPTHIRFPDPFVHLPLFCSCPYSHADADNAMKTAKDILKCKPANAFSEFEWRFFDCPDDQQHWCDVYEHARNNLKLVDAVAHYRVVGFLAWRGLFANPCRQRLACRFFDTFPEFPMKPFLALEGQVRRIRCAELDQERQDMRARQLPLNKQHVASEGMQLWELSEDITKDELEHVWKAIKTKNGRKRVSADRLRDLSLLQLYRYLKTWENVASHLNDMGVRQFSESVSQLCRGGTRAIEDIQVVLNRIL